MSEVIKEVALELEVDGESAYSVESVPALVPIDTDDTGAVTDHTNKAITIYVREGRNARQAATITNYTLPNGFTFVSNIDGVLTFKAGSQATLATSANVQITATYDGLTFGMLIPLVPAKQGEAGADADDTEWIYKYDATGYSGATGEVNPSGAASGSETNKQQKGWVPNGWYNHALAISASNTVVYASYRTLNGATGVWGDFQTPIEWSHWGRNGQDGDGTEYVFIRTQNPVAPVMDSTQTGYATAKFRPTITSASQTASGTEQAQTTDNPKGANDDYPYEWVAKRTMSNPDSSGARTWKKYTGENNDYKMSLWSNLGQDGDGIVSVSRTFAISNVGTTASETTEPTHQGSWTVSSPAVTPQYPYLWAKEVTVFTDTTKNTTKYYCIGARGDNGVDAQDIEWVYIRSKTPTAPTILSDSSYTDSNSHTYTSDGHLPHVSGNANIENNQNTYECTDNPKGVTDTWKYEWEIKRTKGDANPTTGARAWNYYSGSMTMHNNYAESAFIIDIDNDNDQFGTDSDSKVVVAQTRSTNVAVYDGATPQTLTSLTATLEYEDGTSVPTTGNNAVATVSCTANTGAVSVTVLQNNTPNTHTEIQAHITAVCDKGTKNIVFTLYKVMSGAPGLTPIIYNVLATNKTFSFQRTDANELTPSTRSSQINVARTEGNITTTISTATTGLTYSWGFENEATATNAHSGLAIGTSIQISSTDAALHSSVWVLLSTGDRETLSIVKDGANGASGTNGYNTATIFLYKRSASEITQIDWSNSLTYTFSTNSLDSVPTGWSFNAIPSGNNPIYVVAATANSRNATDSIAANEWSSPVMFVENGSQGEHGLNTASVFLYQRGSSAPSKPSGTLTYTFATGVLSGTLGSWSQTIPDTDQNHYPCWVIQATAIGTGSTDTIASTEWSTQKQLVVDGANGNPGGNTATIYLYSRTKTTIDWTNTLTYTFSTQSLSSVPSGWSLNEIPSGTAPIYVTAATAYSTGSTDTIAYTEWATPVKFVENGAQGAHGVNTASLYLYQRASSAPNKPTGALTYTFATGTISGSSLGNWTQVIPSTDSNHYPCWVIQATAISTSDTDTIESTEWSEQQKMVEDGAQGLPGGNTANVMLYKRSASTISSVGISSTLYYKFSTKKLYTNSACTTEATTQLNGWSLTIPSDSTDPIYVTAAIAYSTSESDNIASSEWVTPSQFTDNGSQGEHGVNSAIVFIYKRAASQPSNAPTGYVRYTFADGTTTIESGKSWNNWQTTIPTSDGNPCWVRQAAALGTGTYDDIQTSEWSSVRKLVEDGDEGQSSFKSIVFVRQNTTPDTPTGGSYASPVPSGWNDGIPSGEAQLWSSTRIFTSDGASPQQNAWTTPQPMTDTADFDVEYSTVASSPGNPTDNPSNWGNTASTDTIWMATRDCHNGVWSGWQVSKIKGEKGDNGGTPENRYQWNQSPTSAPSYSASSQNPGSSWKTSVPTRPGDGYYLWTISAIKTGSTYGTWGNAIRLTGDTGSAGEDSAEREWIYKLSTTTSVTIPTTSENTDGYVPTGWANHPSGVDDTNIYEYACYRDKPKGTGTRTWSAWKGITGGASGDAPILWSHWGRNGMDGDGTEYVFVRTKDNVKPAVPTQSQSSTYCEENNNYDTDEHLPYVRVSSSYDISGSTTAVTSGSYKYVKCTDDPVGTDSTWQFEWVLKRSKDAPNSTTGIRAWEKYSGQMSLWSNWADDGENAIRIDLDNQADIIPVDSEGKVRFARTITVKARIYNGSSLQTTSVSLPSQASSYMSALAIGGVAPVIYHTSVADGNKITGTTTSVTGGVLFVVWTFAKGTQLTANTTWNATIQLRYSSVTYDAAFSLTSSDTEAIYQVMPNPSEVSFSKSNSNTLTPSSITLKCGYTKSTGSGTTSVDAATTDANGQITESGTGIGKYLFYRTKTSGSWGSWASYASKTTSTGISVSNSTSVQDYEFAICSSSTYSDANAIDREAVPVVKDGIDGVSSLIVDIDNDSDQFGTDVNGAVQGDQNKVTNVQLFYGTTPQSIYRLVATVYKASAPSTSIGTADATSSGTAVTNNVTISSKVGTIKSEFSGTSGTVTLALLNTKTINDDFIVKIQAYQNSSTSRTTNFTVKQVKSGAAGVAPDLCNLRPTKKSISFNKTEQAGSTAKTLGCGYTLVTQSGTTNTATAASVSVNGTTYYIWWRYVGGTYAKFTTSSTIYSTGILPSTTQTGVEFVLSSASSASNIAAANTLDYENVPIIKDGTDGKSITSANVWYALNQSSTQAPSDYTLDDFPSTLNSGYYVWEATKVTYTDGSWEFTGKMCLGATTEFLTGTEVYAASASNSTTPTSWSTTYTKTKGYYLWAATRVQYTNGTYAYLNPKCVGYWGEDGTSPYFADIDNEMDSVACDKNGKVKASTTCGTNVSLFYGSSKRSYKITGITKNGSSTMGTGVTVKIDDSTPSYPTSASQTHTVSVTYATTAMISSKDDFAITIQDATDTSITRVLHFTINGVREGANGEPAIIFRLNPSASEVVKKKDGTYIPAKTSKVTCAVLKTTGSETSEEPINEIDDYVAKYKLNGTGDEIAFPIGGITVETITSKLEIMLYDANEDVLLDKETIPLVEDGTDGTSPYFADLDNEMDSVLLTDEGMVWGTQVVQTNVSMFYGVTEITPTTITVYDETESSANQYTSGTAKDGITVTINGNNIKASFANNADMSSYEKKVFLIKLVGDGVTRYLNLSVRLVWSPEDGRPATIYNLLPSVSTIKKDADNVLSPTSLTCDVRKTTGNSTPTRATSSDGTLRYRVDGDITSTSDGTALTINTGTVNSYNSTSKYITFAFFKGTTLVDKERVPIVYDGEDAGQMQTNIIRESHFNTLSYWATHVGEVVTDAIGNHKGFKITQSSTASFNSALTQYLANDSRQWLSPSTIYTLSFWLKSDASTSSVYTYLYDYVVDPDYLPYVDGVRRTSASSNYTQYGRQDWESTNGSWVYHTFTFKTNSTRSSYTWKLLFGIWGTGTATATICMPKLELGDKASGYMLAEEEMGESYRILYTWNSTTKIEVKDLPCNADYSGSFSGNFYFYLQRLVDGKWTDCPNYYWAIKGFNSSGGINYGYNGSTKQAANSISSTTVNNSTNRYFEVYYLTEAMTPTGSSTAAVTETTTRKIFMSARISKVPAGANGENSIRLSLDNEHEDFIYSASGKVAPTSITSQAHLYDGATEVTSGVSWAIDVSKSSGVSFSDASAPSISNGLLTVNGLTADTAKVMVKATYNGKDYYAAFTANKTSQDKYDLVFSDNAIAYNPATYTSQTQKRIKVYADVTSLGGTTSKASISTSSGSGTIRLYVTHSGSTVQLTSWITESDVKKIYLDVTPTIAAANNGIYFELRKYSGSSTYDVVDYETVEIAKSENGDEGKGYKAVVERDGSFTESQWNTYGEVGHQENWSNTSSIRGDCGVGDWFIVVGKSSDTGDYHTATYECDNSSDNLHGTCIAHQVTENSFEFSVTPSVMQWNTNNSGTLSGFEANNGTITAYKGSKSLNLTSWGVTNLPLGFVVTYSSAGGFTITPVQKYCAFYNSSGSPATIYVMKARNGGVVAGDKVYSSSMVEQNGTISSVTSSTGYVSSIVWNSKTYSFSSETSTALASPVNAIVSGSAAGATRTLSVLLSPAKQGAQGSTGKMGRFPYFAGVWESFASDATFVASDTATPYFQYTSSGQTRYSVWKGANGTGSGSTIAKSSMGTIGSGSNWETMVSDFKYLITEALFTDMAKLGSGIFNGDYAFSQWGTMNSGKSQSYQNFAPNGGKVEGTLNGPTPILLGSFVAASKAYSFTFTSDVANNAIYFGLSTNATASVGSWAFSWNQASTSYTVTTPTSLTSGTTYYILACKMNGNGSKVSATRLTDAFTPNLYIDWLNGEVYSQLGRFVNVTVEGVINNLSIDINETNYTNYGSRSGSGQIFWLDPTKVGNIVTYNCNSPLGLPSAWHVGAPDVYKISSGGVSITLNELRQCIGKKIYLYTFDNTSMQSFYCGESGNGMFVYETDHNTIEQIASATTETVKYNRVYQYASPQSMKNSFFILECKLGEYDNHECIYWGITRSAFRMDYDAS